MKREHIIHYKHLYKMYTIFCWKICSKCGKEFRREEGWKAFTGPFYNGSGVWRYLCNSCAPNKKVASTYFLNKEWRQPKPDINGNIALSVVE